MACPSRWSFARGQIHRMIICKWPAPPNDHLQEAGSSRSSVARGLSFQVIMCKRLLHPDDHLQQQQQQPGLQGWPGWRDRRRRRRKRRKRKRRRRNSCTRADRRTGQLKKVQEVLADLKITLHCNLDLAGGCCKMLLTYFEGVFFSGLCRWTKPWPSFKMLPNSLLPPWSSVVINFRGWQNFFQLKQNSNTS